MLDIEIGIMVVKSRLVNDAARRGISENFGQREYRSLIDKYGYFPSGDTEERKIARKIDAFEEWACTYTVR